MSYGWSLLESSRATIIKTFAKPQYCKNREEHNGTKQLN